MEGPIDPPSTATLPERRLFARLASVTVQSGSTWTATSMVPEADGVHAKATVALPPGPSAEISFRPTSVPSTARATAVPGAAASPVFSTVAVTV